jgi:chaperonin GroEL
MSTAGDIAPLLEKVVAAGGHGKELVLVGEVSDEVLGMLLLNRMKGIINVTPVDLPIYGPMRSLTLEDLAQVTGGKVYVQGANPSDFDVSLLGGAQKVIINEFSTTIIGGEGVKEDIDARVSELHKQLQEADSAVTVDALRDRLSRLTGKVAIIRVGGATEVEQKEVKLRVEDAVCAVQAAIKDGVVPGGGVALARVATQNIWFVEVFDELFKQLIENAGYSSDRALWTMLAKTNPWYGYDLTVKEFDYKPVDLMRAGVIDPASVIKEVVLNAASEVAKLITAETSNSLASREEKHD